MSAAQLTKNLALVVASTMLALLAGEGIVRLLKAAPPIHRIQTGEDDRPYTRSDNPILGYEMMTDYRRDPATEKPRHQGADFLCDRTNAFGFRDVERTVPRVPGKKRLLLLGDSVVVGHGIWDFEDTISRNLERLFPSGDVEVLNFGIGGYNTRSEAELLSIKGVQFAPDLVILIILENDFLPYNTQIRKYAFERPEWSETLFVKSDLFRMLSLAANLFEFREQLDPDRYRIEENERAMKDEFKTSVASGFHVIHELQKEHGFDMLVLTWPNFTKETVSDDPFYRMVSEAAAPYGFPVLRLGPAFLTHYKRTARSAEGPQASPHVLYTVGDGMHPNEYGTRVAAEAIHGFIVGRRSS